MFGGMKVSEFMVRALPLMLSNNLAPLNCTLDRSIRRNVLVAAMFNFEVDTLELALHNYCGVADVLLVESHRFHNTRQRAYDRRPVLWPVISRHARFKSLRGVVVKHVTCSSSNNDHDMWSEEYHMDTCMSNAIKVCLGETQQYASVVVNSVDEILSRDALVRLSTSPIVTPTSATAGFFMSKATVLFQSDWPSAGNPYSFALPTLYPNTSTTFTRQFKEIARGRNPNSGMYGGAHLTNYCFWPNRVIKEATATEYGGAWNPCDEKSDAETKCYSYFKHRTRPWHPMQDTHAVLPPAMAKQRYPAWYGARDPRELQVRRIC